MQYRTDPIPAAQITVGVKAIFGSWYLHTCSANLSVETAVWVHFCLPVSGSIQVKNTHVNSPKSVLVSMVYIYTTCISNKDVS